MSEKPVDDLNGPAPTDFSLSVVMQRSPATSPWQKYLWEAVGVTAAPWEAAPQTVSLVHQQGEVCHYLYSGYRLQLHADECESYYHNLCSPTPRCFVMARENGEGTPVPFLLSLSFDQANACEEVDETVYAVAMPPELYRWCELFVLNHFVPEKRKKRRLTDWRKETGGSAAL